MMIIDNKYSIGDTVYLKTDTDQYPRLVYGFIIYQNTILYTLTAGTQTSHHYDFEISIEKNVLIIVNS